MIRGIRSQCLGLSKVRIKEWQCVDNTAKGSVSFTIHWGIFTFLGLRLATVFAQRIHQRCVLVLLTKFLPDDAFDRLLEFRRVKHNFAWWTMTIREYNLPKVSVLLDTFIDAHSEAPKHQRNDPTLIVKSLLNFGIGR